MGITATRGGRNGQRYVSGSHDEDLGPCNNSWNFPLTVLFLRDVGTLLETLGLPIVIVVYMDLASTREK